MSSTVENTDRDGAGHAEALLGLAGGWSLAELPGRDLAKRELLELVATLAAEDFRWRREVAFPAGERHYVSLHRDEHVDIWLLCWTPSNDTGWHDHDRSSGAVAVAQGELVEYNLLIGRPSVATTVAAGQAYCFGPEHIHRLTGLAAGSVSIHAYSPPLGRLGQYTVGAGGVLRRVSVSYVDELRPLDDMI